MNIARHFVGLPGGLLMSIIAFSTVFIVIAGLMLMMMALKAFATSVERKEAAAKAPVPTPPAPASSAAPAAPAAAQAADEAELLAVITAAIAAMCGSAARVVSFTPAPPRQVSSPWRMSGMIQNSEGFVD